MDEARSDQANSPVDSSGDAAADASNHAERGDLQVSDGAGSGEPRGELRDTHTSYAGGDVDASARAERGDLSTDGDQVSRPRQVLEGEPDKLGPGGPGTEASDRDIPPSEALDDTAARQQPEATGDERLEEKVEHSQEPPISIVRCTPAEPWEREQERRVGNGESTPKEALEWFQTHGVPVQGLPYWNKEQHIWIFPDQTGGLDGPAAPHPGGSTWPDSPPGAPNPGQSTGPGHGDGAGMPTKELNAKQPKPSSGEQGRASVLSALAGVLWDIATSPTPGTPDILNIRNIFEFGYARQGFLAGIVPAPLEPPTDPQDRAEWDRGQQVAMLVVLADVLTGLPPLGGPGAGPLPAVASEGGGWAAAGQPGKPWSPAYEARGGGRQKGVKPKQDTKAADVGQQKPAKAQDSHQGTREPLVPGSAAHKLQRWIDYQVAHNVPNPTEKIDAWWSAKYDTVIANKGSGSRTERELLEALGFPKNTAAMIAEEGNGFIPDAIVGAPTSITWGEKLTFIEVKDWADMSHTGNVKAMMDYVRQVEGSKLILYSRNGSYMSGPLVKELDALRLAGKVEVRFF